MEQTTFNLGPYLLGGFIGMIIGWVIGFFDSNLRSSKKIKQAEETAQIALQDAKDKIAQAEARVASVAAIPMTVDDPGLLRIKTENGALTLDIDGSRVNPLALYPEQRKRLIEMLNVMRPWLENKPVSMPAPATPPLPPSQPMPTPANYAASPSQSVPPVPAPVQKPTPASASKKDEAPAAAPASMVGQINAILQARIANTKLATIGVTMIESPSGGVFVYVGLNKFEGIDAVPDEEVKAAIRAAIAEWEKKYTPGL
jgi:hypothetical protein